MFSPPSAEDYAFCFTNLPQENTRTDLTINFEKLRAKSDFVNQ